MKERLVQLIFGSALHDIGKVVQRATGERRRHPAIGAEFLKDYFEDRSVLHQLSYHHDRELRTAKIPQDDLAYITYIADNIASGLDRRTRQEIEQSTYLNWDPYQPQHDIFNTFRIGDYPDQVGRSYRPKSLDDRSEMNRAREEAQKFTPGYYQGIVKRLADSFKYMSVSSDYIDSFFSLLEACLSYVPSSTNLDEVADISLYDHSKLTAAIASCIYEYLEEASIQDYHKTLYRQASDFYHLPVFRLLKIDISGIQNFIYTIRDQKASKMLRSRSFYLELILENLIDELIEQADLSRANLLYSGGGNAYVLLPNTQRIVGIIDQIESSMNHFLRETFQDQLYLAFASVPCAAEVLNPSDQDSQGYSQLYADLSRLVAKKKLSRYSAQEIRSLNQAGKRRGRECPICHRIHQHEAQQAELSGICDVCEGLINFSKAIYQADFFEVTTEETLLPIGFNKYLRAKSKEAITREGDHGRIYSKNKFHTGLNQRKNLWVGDYTDGMTFEDYAGKGKLPTLGIQKLGVLRCDVDDLGSAFIAGFTGKYNTISRSATFSRSLALFFQFHINDLMERERVAGTIIYSGGDDVFIIGSWWDLLEFSMLLRQEFVDYSQHKLTLSAGLGLFDNKTPVPILASQTGYLEEVSKSRKGADWLVVKDAITVFEERYCFSWDRFIDHVYGEKYDLLDRFFQAQGEDSEYGKTFANRLLELIRLRDQEVAKLEGESVSTISSARWVYFLTRMEPKQEDHLDLYKSTTQKLLAYFKDKQERLELECALLIYLYTIRETDN